MEIESFYIYAGRMVALTTERQHVFYPIRPSAQDAPDDRAGSAGQTEKT